MSSVEETKQRLELLKMARTLLNEEYINRRAEDHNKWLAECDSAWRTQRIKLPYPPFAPYPTEAEIVAKALVLYTFVNPDSTTKPDVAELTVQEKAAVEVAIKQKNEAVTVPIKTPWEIYLTPTTAPVESTTETTTAAPVTATVATSSLVEPLKDIATTKSDFTAPIADIFVAEVKEEEKAGPASEVIPNEEISNLDNRLEKLANVQPSTFSSSMKNIIPNFWRQRESGEK